MFSEKLRHSRTEAGLTQVELAVTLGVSYSAIQKWEGGTGTPRPRTLVKIAEFFEWNPNDVMAILAADSGCNHHMGLDLHFPLVSAA